MADFGTAISLNSDTSDNGEFHGSVKQIEEHLRYADRIRDGELMHIGCHIDIKINIFL